MDYQAFKNAVIACAAELGIGEYELYYVKSSDTSIDAFQHQINEFSSNESGGVCFRCIVDGKMGYASTQLLSEDEAKSIVAQAAENARSLEADEQVFLCEGGLVYQTVEQTTYPLPTTEELIETVLATQEKLYAASPAIIDGSQSQAVRESTEVAIFNSKGLDLFQKAELAAIVVQAVATDGREMATSFDVKAGELSKIDTDALVKKAADQAVLKLGGEVPPTAVCPVVFSPDAMASLLQTFSAIFSSENAQKGLSKLGAAEGTKIAADCVTLVDDPFYAESPIKSTFDAEGCPTSKKNVIENGVLNTLLYNMKTAAVAGKQTTGNASKAGYDGAVLVRPFAMYLAPGDKTEEEIYALADEGILITSLGGLHAGANPISGDFSLQSSGFAIHGGKKCEYIKSFTVAGNFYELLNSVSALGDKVEVPMPLGTTMFGSPYVLIEKLSIAGK